MRWKAWSCSGLALAGALAPAAAVAQTGPSQPPAPQGEVVDACLADVAAVYDELMKAVEMQYAKLIAAAEHDVKALDEAIAASPDPKLIQRRKDLQRQISRLRASLEAARREVATERERTARVCGQAAPAEQRCPVVAVSRPTARRVRAALAADTPASAKLAARRLAAEAGAQVSTMSLAALIGDPSSLAAIGRVEALIRGAATARTLLLVEETPRVARAGVDLGAALDRFVARRLERYPGILLVSRDARAGKSAASRLGSFAVVQVSQTRQPTLASICAAR